MTDKPSQPLVSPILLAVQQYALRSEPASDPLLQPTAHSRISAFAFDTIPGTLAAGLLSTLVLSGGDLRASALSIVPVIAMLVVYAALEHGSTTERTRFFPRLDVQRSILPLAFRVFILLAVCLAIDTALFGFRTAHVPTTIALGIAKALSWYFTARAVCVEQLLDMKVLYCLMLTLISSGQRCVLADCARHRNV